MPTTEAGIVTFGLSQLYVSLGDPMADGGIVVRIWWKPWILCIWYGTLVMMAGGIVSTMRYIGGVAGATALSALLRDASSPASHQRPVLVYAGALVVAAALSLLLPGRTER